LVIEDSRSTGRVGKGQFCPLCNIARKEGTMDNSEIEKVEDIKSRLEEVGDYLHKSKERQRRLRWWSYGVTVAIVIVFVIYAAAFYKMIARNLSAENFTNSIQSHMADIVPVLINSSQEVMTQVAPVYVEAARKKAASMEPEFRKRLKKHTDIFVSNMATFAQNEFRTRLNRIVSQQVEEFHKAYPDLTDRQIEQFINETEGDLNKLFLELSEHIVNESYPHITELKHLAETLSDRHRHINDFELHRLFLHKLLLLLDYEIMEGTIS